MFWSLVPASWSTLFSWPLSPNTCLFFFLLLWLLLSLLHRFSLSAHPLNISVFRILAHFHSIQLPWVILSTPMLMTLKYIFLFPMVFLNISSLSNGTANLSKTYKKGKKSIYILYILDFFGWGSPHGLMIFHLSTHITKTGKKTGKKIIPSRCWNWRGPSCPPFRHPGISACWKVDWHFPFVVVS